MVNLSLSDLDFIYDLVTDMKTTTQQAGFNIKQRFTYCNACLWCQYGSTNLSPERQGEN